MLAVSGSLGAVKTSPKNLEINVIHQREDVKSLSEKPEMSYCGNDCTSDGKLVEENEDLIVEEGHFNSSENHHLPKRSPIKIGSKIAAAWSKKLKVFGFIYPPPLSWYFKAYSLFDAGLTKALKKVPIVGKKKRSPIFGRKKRSPKILSLYAAAWSKWLKLTGQPLYALVDKMKAKALFKVPIVGRKKRSPKILSAYAAAWSKFLKLTGQPLYALFDAKLAKALFKVPIVGRRKRSPKVLSAYAAGWSKLWKSYALMSKLFPPASKYFKFMGVVDGGLAKLLFKVPIVGRK